MAYTKATACAEAKVCSARTWGATIIFAGPATIMIAGGEESEAA